MTTFKRMLSIGVCMALLSSLPALAEAPQPPQPTALPAEETVEALMAQGVEVEGMAMEEEPTTQGDAVGQKASIEGLTPLYTTTIRPFVSNGTAIRMRAEQSGDSEVICAIRAYEPITVYAVYPSYVLAEYQGHVGYVIRTWVDEAMVPLDPVNTPPYGVVPSAYVATLTQQAKVYDRPSFGGEVFDIHPGAGSKIAVLEFVNGFAKVLYWRSYGYIDARLLSDLTVVSPTDEPLSPNTPIAAFCSFFEYGTGSAGNEGRCLNIVRSCELMTRVMQPGESLDFNAQIGPYKKSNGYHAAPVLIDGGSQLGYGGGTCQSSSTLYNTVRQLGGVTILKRRPHGPGCARYLPMHQDAAVGNTELNFIFRNDYDFPIRIVAESTGEGTLCIQVFKGE